MTPIARTGLSALVLVTAFALSNTSALAWGCAAVSEEGTYGYSYSYDNEGAARERALNECANRTSTDSVCEIVECDEDE